VADVGTVSVEVDVVVRSVRWAPQARALPTAVELARALATVNGGNWPKLDTATQDWYLTRANDLRYVLGGDLPTEGQDPDSDVAASVESPGGARAQVCCEQRDDQPDCVCCVENSPQFRRRGSS
jgi:hypothetical protein